MDIKSIKEGFKKRPGMYLGDTKPNGISKILRNCIEELITFYGNQQQQYVISILSDRDFSISVSAKSEVSLLPMFTPLESNKHNLIQFIRFACSELKIFSFY